MSGGEAGLGDHQASEGPPGHQVLRQAGRVCWGSLEVGGGEGGGGVLIDEYSLYSILSKIICILIVNNLLNV